MSSALKQTLWRTVRDIEVVGPVDVPNLIYLILWVDRIDNPELARHSGIGIVVHLPSQHLIGVGVSSGAVREELHGRIGVPSPVPPAVERCKFSVKTR